MTGPLALFVTGLSAYGIWRAFTRGPDADSETDKLIVVLIAIGMALLGWNSN